MVSVPNLVIMTALTRCRIESLLEESYNERMHLLTFLKMSEPGWFMRFLVLGAQGVWCNALFFAYLISPRTVHRFVGYLEEEAVITYTRQIQDLDAGRLPKWEKLDAPQIAIDYWHMPEGHRTMRDLLLYSMHTLVLVSPHLLTHFQYAQMRVNTARSTTP